MSAFAHPRRGAPHTLEARFVAGVVARHRRAIAAIVGGAALASVCVALALGARYTATFTVLTPEGPTGGLLASIRRSLYDRGVQGWVIPAVVGDDRFLQALALRRIDTGDGRTTTLADAWGADDARSALRAARRFVRAHPDPANGVVRVDVTAPDPRVATAGARAALEALEGQLDAWRESLRAERRRYHAGRLAQARARADSLEADLRAFLASNRGWTESDHADLAQALDRFERRRRVVAGVYRELRKRAELDDIEVITRVPPLEVLDEPAVPSMRSWPPRRVLVTGAVAAAIIAAVGLAFVLEARPRERIHEPAPVRRAA